MDNDSNVLRNGAYIAWLNTSNAGMFRERLIRRSFSLTVLLKLNIGDKTEADIWSRNLRTTWDDLVWEYCTQTDVLKRGKELFEKDIEIPWKVIEEDDTRDGKIKWRHARATLLAGRPKRYTSAQSRQFPNMLWTSPKHSFWWTETFFAIFQSFMSNSFRLYLNSEKMYPEHIPNIPKICSCHYKPLFGNHGSMHFNEHPSWQHL